MADRSDRGRAREAALADRIAEYLAGTGRALTSAEIARGVHARHADVIHALSHDIRFYRWPSGTRRKPYGVADVSEEGRDASEPRERSGVVIPLDPHSRRVA